MNAPRLLSVSFLALALVAGAVLGLKRHEAAELRGEIALLREEGLELARLRAENQRLAATLPPAATLEAWRVDHTAVSRLRAEIEKLKGDVRAREQALARTKR